MCIMTTGVDVYCSMFIHGLGTRGVLTPHILFIFPFHFSVHFDLKLEFT